MKRILILAVAALAIACAQTTAPRQEECRSGYSVATGKCMD